MKKCSICNKKIIRTSASANNVKYCKECRQEAYKYTEYRTEWQRKKRDELATKPSAKKVQCLICNKWYVQVGSHIVQVHGLTAREYREAYDLEVKRGIVPPWFREMKGEQALQNGTVANLKKGKKFWFKKGDKNLGRYHRSPVTMEKLKVLYKYKKQNDI